MKNAKKNHVVKVLGMMVKRMNVDGVIMAVRNKQLIKALKEECTECEICGNPCEFVNYKCREPEYGSMAEVTSVCKACHKKWSLCNCFNITSLNKGNQE